MGDLLRSALLLLSAGQTAARRAWVLPLAVASGLLTEGVLDALGTEQPSGQLALGLVLAALGLWRLVAPTDSVEPVVAVVAGALVTGLEHGRGTAAAAGAIAGVAVLALPKQHRRVPTQLSGLVLVLLGVSHAVDGVLSV